MKYLIITSLTIIVLITLLFIHHYITHGRLYDAKDFSDAVYYIVKSHEGIILLGIVLQIGILIGGIISRFPNNGGGGNLIAGFK